MTVQATSGARRTRKSSAPSKKAHSAAATIDTPIDPERRRGLIAEAAYLRAERRGFLPGHEEEDWLAAEIEIDTALTVRARKAVQ